MRAIAALWALTALVPVTAQADPCASDIGFVCPGQSGRELTACLDRAGHQISQECRTDRANRKAQLTAKVFEACSAELNEHCANPPEDINGRQMSKFTCLEQRRDSASKTCRDAFTALENDMR